VRIEGGKPDFGEWQTRPGVAAMPPLAVC